jgi:hypothetical protein
VRYKVKTQMMMEETLWVEADSEDEAKEIAHGEASYVDGSWYDAEILEEEDD